MHDDRFEQALHALRTSSVEPALIPDDSLPAKPRSLWYGVGIGAVMAVVGIALVSVLWKNADGGGEARATLAETQSSVAAKLNTIADSDVPVVAAKPESASSAALEDGLLVVNLTEDELQDFGITIHDGGTRVTTERMLVAGQCYGVLASDLRAIGIDEDDSLELVRVSIDITADSILRKQTVRRAELERDNHLPVAACRHDIVSDGSKYDQFYGAILDDSSLISFTYWSMDSILNRIIPGVTDGIVPTKSDIWSDRTRRPVIWAHRFVNSDRVLLAFMMPTSRLRSKLPVKYRSDFDRVYGRYIPQKPTSTRSPEMWKPEWPRPTIVLAAEQAGLTAIEPDHQELWRLGLAVCSDYVSTAMGSVAQGYHKRELVSVSDTISMLSWSFRPVGFDTADPSSAYTYPDTVRVVRPNTAGQSFRFELPEGSSFRIMGDDGLPRIGSTGATGSEMQSGDSVWRSRFPLFSELAFRVAYELSTTFVSIDSLLRYEAVIGDLRMPVTKILVPVRVVSPYRRYSNVDTSLVRADVVLWYAPSDLFFQCLPDRIRTFIEDEYKAVASILEQRLSGDDLCSLLDKPSALGLCSIGDTVLRLDGIGPIPAREEMTIFLRSTQATTATISLLDDAGRTILERTNVPVERGNNRLRLDLTAATLVRGAYTVVIKTEIGMRTSRVLVER